ncbi:DoxX family protein [Myxococcus stipitatus]|uniref:DoxX family protein n=1 Tax=Myxococcus stipitatus TaxID=83455 RepID=UPI001F2089B8|nr:DoxX family protein [Myxococcus stipitatus]MCE9667759.1 DoxX family protein [Myxococcus stipitatus]
MRCIESPQSSPVTHAVGATVLRLALGAVFLAHAGAKVFLFTLPGTSQFFEAHGIPGWTAWPVFLVELFGGLALVAGFRTRLVALGLVPVMLGALVPHVANGWMFSNPGGGWEYVAFLGLALVTQALVGSGAYALDGACARREVAAGEVRRVGDVHA